MKLNFLFPGKTKEAFLAQGISAYIKRLKPMVETNEIIFKTSSAPSESNPASESLVRAREASQLLERCGAGEYLIVLDSRGELLSSTALAEKFEQLRLSAVKTVNLVVGGHWGIDDNLLAKANLRLSLGPMTYPHELARLIILEQVYRAFTILNHIPYHK